MMEIGKTFGLFVLTALAEILGCYLPQLWLKQGGSAWLLVPAAFSLIMFAWLLSLHPTRLDVFMLHMAEFISLWLSCGFG
jgi:small multidrug resistance family-3 protein